MKAIIERGAFFKALGHVQSVVERRNTIPVLSNVMLTAEGSALTLTATDLEIEIHEKTAADISAPGTITVPAHVMYDIVRQLPDGAQIELSLDETGNRLLLISGKSSFTLQSLPSGDFPVMQAGDMPHVFALPAETLRTLIEKTSFAISVEETRYYLNGIYLHHVSDDDTPLLRAVATDGHRLARMQTALPTGAEDMPDVIVPRKTVNEIQKLLEGVDGEVSIQISDPNASDSSKRTSAASIKFTFADIMLTSKLIDGKFPDYNRVIPQNNDKTLTIDSKAFGRSVELVSAISSEKSRAVRLGLEKQKLTFSVSNPDGGSASDELPVAYKGVAMDIGFNSGYLLDIVSQLDGEKAVFELADSGSPTLIRDAKDKQALYVLMPMRV